MSKVVEFLKERFNSILVRLKGAHPVDPTSLPLSGFNSILVRLKGFHDHRYRRHVTHVFQFHTGSIKSELSNIVHRVDILFQFHTGSIKSDSPRRKRMYLAVFQFHTGSIKSQQKP